MCTRLTSYLKLLTQTELIPAFAAAWHTTGTTSETCFHKKKKKTSVTKRPFLLTGKKEDNKSYRNFYVYHNILLH